MKTFKVNDGKNEISISLPTKLSEITEDYLLGVTKHIEIAPYHAIVGVIYRCKLPEIISSSKKSRALATAIVPIFVKCNFKDESNKDLYDLFNNMSCGDKIIIAGTDVERGYQLSCPKNTITIENMVRIYNADNNFAKNVMLDQNYYYFADFKLVPVGDIKGCYNSKADESFVNPFIEINGNELGN